MDDTHEIKDVGIVLKYRVCRLKELVSLQHSVPLPDFQTPGQSGLHTKALLAAPGVCSDNVLGFELA